jgi:hypothetical protein
MPRSEIGGNAKHSTSQLKVTHAINGKVLFRLPVKTNIALLTAAAKGGTAGSPTPAGGLVLATIQVSTVGACFI